MSRQSRNTDIAGRFKHLARIAGTVGLAGAMASAVPNAIAETNTAATIDTKIELDRSLVLTGQTDPIFVLVRMNAKDLPIDPDKKRPPLNIALVLDRSGSMSDKGKIEYLKSAAKQAVDRLGGRDHLAIVEYDDVITVMWPSSRVESTFPIKRLIDGLEPRGSTDLVGGMMTGADQVRDRMKEIEADEAINRVLLLSDGLANHGVTDPRQIRRLVRTAKADGVRISTMGLGRDYDEDLMQDIAENAGGSYYYIESPNQMARIFEQELKTLFTTVVKEARFEFDAAPGIKSIGVLSFGSAEDPNTPKFDMENFYAGDERTVLLRIVPEAGLFETAGQKVDLGRISFSYKDVETGKVEQVSAPVAVEVTDDAAAVASATNSEVVVEANLFEAERRQKEAIDQYQAGNFEEADRLMTELEKDVATANVTLKDKRLDNKVEAVRVERSQMTDAQTSASAQSDYLKSTKQRLFNAQKGKRSLYLLQLGDKGFEVERLQEALKEAGYYDGPVDGVYSEDVEAAVEQVQNDETLDVDGVAGPATMEALGVY